MIIAFSGKMGSGKSVASNWLKNSYGFKKISFADKLKDMAEEKFPGIKLLLSNPRSKNKPYFKNGESPRDFAIKLGQFMRYWDEDYWVKAAGIDKVKGDLTIDDVRFPNEAEYIKKLGGKVVRINRYPHLNIYGPEPLDDPSETSLDDYKGFDFVIQDCVNISLNDLYKQVNNALDNFEEEEKP